MMRAPREKKREWRKERVERVERDWNSVCMSWSQFRYICTEACDALAESSSPIEEGRLNGLTGLTFGDKPLNQ